MEEFDYIIVGSGSAGGVLAGAVRQTLNGLHFAVWIRSGSRR
jgi:pyruvate/2-oxoglutarate dehydrogenase complex dihydrolipoamide dehydrogenase (E3) component